MTHENDHTNGTTDSNEIFWQPPNSTAIKKAIEKYKILQLWLHSRTNETKISCDTDEHKKKISLSLIQTALDSADGIALLVENDLPAPAMILLRPMLEAHERLLWINNHASDQVIGEVWNTKRFPDSAKLRKLVHLNNQLDPERQSLLRTVLNTNIGFLNDFVHTNFDHVDSRITSGSVEPMFYESTIIYAVELAKIVVANCAHQHIELCCIASKNELRRIAKEAGLDVIQETPSHKKN